MEEHSISEKSILKEKLLSILENQVHQEHKDPNSNQKPVEEDPNKPIYDFQIKKKANVLGKSEVLEEKSEKNGKKSERKKEKHLKSHKSRRSYSSSSSRSRSRSHRKDKKVKKDEKKGKKQKENYHYSNKKRSKSRSRTSSKEKAPNQEPHLESEKSLEHKSGPTGELNLNDLETKFKFFEAEIRAIDSLNSNKNETKTKKIVENSENLTFLSSKRLFIEGLPLDDEISLSRIRNTLESISQKRDFGILSKNEKPIYIFVDFDGKEDSEQALQVLQKYEFNGKKLDISRFIDNESSYNKQPLEKKEENKILESNNIETPKENVTITPVENLFATLNSGLAYSYLQNSMYNMGAANPNYYTGATIPTNQYYGGYNDMYAGQYYSQYNLDSVYGATNSGLGGTTIGTTYGPNGVIENTTNSDIAVSNFMDLIPKILPEANVFIKNLNPQTTQLDIENTFRIYGNIVSCKIATDYYGASLGYAYIQFENKESADQCILCANNAVFQDNIISVGSLNSKVNKSDCRNNLYIKNLPSYLDENQLNQKLVEIFGKFGPITSSVVKMDRNLNRPFAFICFDSHIYADMAFKALHDTDPFKSGNRLYISWAEKKTERVKRLTELHNVQQGMQTGYYGYKM